MSIPCNHCICKTCAIAEVNGGAPGCGDCYTCLNSGVYSHKCDSCKEYYNTDNCKNFNIAYIIRRREEENENNN